jgi:hypothetical protein
VVNIHTALVRTRVGVGGGGSGGGGGGGSGGGGTGVLRIAPAQCVLVSIVGVPPINARLLTREPALLSDSMCCVNVHIFVGPSYVVTHGFLHLCDALWSVW